MTVREMIRYDDRDDNGVRLVISRFTKAPLVNVDMTNGKHMVLNKHQLMQLGSAIDDLIDEIEEMET